jgi:hypothetical protein
MNSWAERMIVKEVQEADRIKQNEIALQKITVQEKMQEIDISNLRLFSYDEIDYEWFWRFIAYAYFICRTLGLSILIDFYIFRKPDITLFLLILSCCCYFNLKLIKYISSSAIFGK